MITSSHRAMPAEQHSVAHRSPCASLHIWPGAGELRGPSAVLHSLLYWAAWFHSTEPLSHLICTFGLVRRYSLSAPSGCLSGLALQNFCSMVSTLFSSS